ncbi:MAG: hypothetical protein ACFKPT_27890 [Gloeotrichia echinulata GP01]
MSLEEKILDAVPLRQFSLTELYCNKVANYQTQVVGALRASISEIAAISAQPRIDKVRTILTCDK